MIGMGVGAPALGGEERSDEAPRAGSADQNRDPDPEVVAKPTRRQFAAEHKLRILKETDRCSGPGDVGQILGDTAQPLLARIVGNIDEFYGLSALRDTLLANLAPGEMRLRDTEKVVGAIA